MERCFQFGKDVFNQRASFGKQIFRYNGALGRVTPLVCTEGSIAIKNSFLEILSQPSAHNICNYSFCMQTRDFIEENLSRLNINSFSSPETRAPEGW